MQVQTTIKLKLCNQSNHDTKVKVCFPVVSDCFAVPVLQLVFVNRAANYQGAPIRDFTSCGTGDLRNLTKGQSSDESICLLRLSVNQSWNHQQANVFE